MHIQYVRMALWRAPSGHLRPKTINHALKFDDDIRNQRAPKAHTGKIKIVSRQTSSAIFMFWPRLELSDSDDGEHHERQHRVCSTCMGTHVVV